MSAHNFYTVVSKNEGGFTFVELEKSNEIFAGNDSLSVLHDEYYDVVRVYEKNTDISHEEFANVADDTQGTWFVAQITKESVHVGHEFSSVRELREALPKLLDGVRADLLGDKELEVVIYPPNADTVYKKQ
ncbi:hypothetical protein bcgnr5378_05020 [Bacillus cereus]|uniref:Uncharacterized protein n=1 Tax=Bacillus cereus TaxID=1396 RepID=A0A164LE20_BACCE|nr:hypothetical protein [Bacillus cereus]KZD55716.1 hypothetical protein B4088_5461 [Bacillus cereus]